MKNFTIIVLIASIILLSSPQKAKAQYVVFDPAQQIKDYALDSLAYVTSAIVLKRLTAKTVNWINSGFKGNPGYIQNPKQFFLDIGDEVASDFLSQAGINQICAPFNARVRLALVKNYINDDAGNYSCTLDILRNNYQAFMNDFSQGGLDAWFEVTQNPQNNPYGAYLEAQNSLSLQINANQQQTQKELDLSGGFLNFKRCPRGAIYVSDPVTLQTRCSVQEETVTPGVVINDQLTRSLGSSWDRLNAADELNEIVTALLTQMVEQVTNKATGLFGGSERNAAGRVLTNDLRDEQQPMVSYPITATSGSINCNATGGTGGDGSIDTDGDGIPDSGGTGGSGGNARCTSTPGTIRGLPPWPLGGGTDSGGHSCPAYTPNPSVDCTRVSSSAVLAVLNGFPASNNGMRDAAPIIQSQFGGVLMVHPIRLDKFDFGNGLIVDVMIGAVGSDGPDGENSIAEGGWGWLVECSCNRDPAGHAGTPTSPPIQINTTYSVTFTVSGPGTLTETTSGGSVSFTSTSATPTVITRTYTRDSFVSISAQTQVGGSVTWGGVCAPFGNQLECSGIVSGDGAVSATFR
jgi:hypothetical protein